MIEGDHFMKRRDFIGKFAQTAVAASTVAVCRPAWADQQVVGANERIRVGWIGCGFRGNHVASAMRTVPGRAYYRANGPGDRSNGMAFYGTNGSVVSLDDAKKQTPTGPKGVSH